MKRFIIGATAMLLSGGCFAHAHAGMVPDDMRQRIFARLARAISDDTAGHIGTGLVGAQFLNRVLSDNGRPDLAWTRHNMPISSSGCRGTS